MPRELDKGDEEKTENLIDVGDADEKATEVDLDKKAEGGEVKDEKTTQDSDKPADAPAKLDEPVMFEIARTTKNKLQRKK